MFTIYFGLNDHYQVSKIIFVFGNFCPSVIIIIIISIIIIILHLPSRKC
jgi:hypothetical protein